MVGPRRSTYELRLFDLRGYIGGDLFQFDKYEKTFGRQAGTLSEEDEAEILQSWFDGKKRSASTYVSAVPVAVTYRPEGKRWGVGAGLRARTISEVKTGRGPFDLLLLGADSSRTVPVDGRYRTYNTVDLTGTFSYKLASIPLWVGASPRLIIGTGYADGRLRSDVLVTDSTVTHNFDYRARAAGAPSRDVYDTFDVISSSPIEDVSLAPSGSEIAGIGGAIDLGATYKAGEGLYVSLSLTDLGYIRWTGDPQTVTPENNTFRFDGVELNRNRIDSEFGGDVAAYFESQVDSLARNSYEDVRRNRSGFGAGLPTAISAGGTWAEGRYVLNGGLSVGLNSTAGAVSPSPSAYVGGEVRLGPIPVRAGLRVGGPQAITLAGGFGLDLGAYRFDLSLSAVPNTSTIGSGARYAIGLSLATIRL